MKHRTGWMKVAGIAFGIALAARTAAPAGSLEPPGPPEPTMKPLDEVEARIPLSQTTTPGDANSFYRISNPGSYYLIDTTGVFPARHGIVIASDNVTIDLNGYNLRGAPNSTSLTGIQVEYPGPYSNIKILNGSITGFGGHGVDAAAAKNVHVEDVQASNNGPTGLTVGEGSLIVNVVASENNGVGILAGAGSVVQSVVARQNYGHGMIVKEGSTVADCSVMSNGGSGIYFNVNSSGGPTIRGCTVHANNGHGIRVIGNGSRVVGNHCTYNGLNALSSAGISINGSGNLIEGNTVLTSEFGIQVIDVGNTIVRNIANFNVVEYDIASGNDVGPIGYAATATSPWANLQ
jgi:hypothetical protein